MRGSALKNWLLTIVSLLFVVLGLALSILKHDVRGLAPAGFFAACAVVGVWSVLRDREIQAHAGALSIEIPENVPLRRRVSQVVILGVVLVVSGTSMMFIPTGTSPLISMLLPGCGVGVAVLGLLFLVGLALGKMRGPSLQFEATGLRLGQRGFDCLIEWRNIARVAPGELAGHDLLLIAVRDAARLLSTVTPPAAAGRLQKQLASNQAWYAADIVLMAVMFGTTTVALAQAMRRYWVGPDGSRLPAGAGSEPSNTPPA